MTRERVEQATGPSALKGIIERMRRAGVEQDAIDEIDRVLGLLRGRGWAGGITADTALTALTNALAESESRARSQEKQQANEAEAKLAESRFEALPPEVRKVTA